MSIVLKIQLIFMVPALVFHSIILASQSLHLLYQWHLLTPLLLSFRISLSLACKQKNDYQSENGCYRFRRSFFVFGGTSKKEKTCIITLRKLSSHENSSAIYHSCCFSCFRFKKKNVLPNFWGFIDLVGK